MIGDRERVNGHGVEDAPGSAESYEVPHLNPPPGILSYHAFCLDADGGIATNVTVEAQTDAEAMTIVDAWPNAYGIDLWERGRLIASFPPRPNGGAALANCSMGAPATVSEG